MRRVWSLDGTAPGPGPVLTPDLIATDGRLDGDPGYEYAVIDTGLAIAGTPVATQGATKVVRIAKPLRLQNSLAGVFSDGWIGSKIPADRVIADYNQFDAPKKPGVVDVTLSRKGFCGPHAPGPRPDRGRHDRARPAEATGSSAASPSSAAGRSTAAPSGRSRSRRPVGRSTSR